MSYKIASLFTLILESRMKKKMVYILLISAAILPLSGCRDQQEKEANPTFMFWCFRKEIVSAEYKIPEMQTPEVARYIQQRLKKALPGVVETRADLANHTLWVSYKSSTIRKMNIEEEIAQMGFAVNYRPANPSARIPKELLAR
jgi:hypothetical protein